MELANFADTGLILASDVRGLLNNPRELSRAAERGHLIQLRRGAYVDVRWWESITDRERHILRVRAVAAAASAPVIAAGLSAAALWGIPISGHWPEEVTVLDRWKGGGRSDPGVRRTAGGFNTSSLDDVDGIRVTSLARTVVYIATKFPLERSVGSIDWAISERCPQRLLVSDLVADLNRMPGSPGFRRAATALGFANGDSGSFGESQGRAVIHLLGFEAPRLQERFVDEIGEMFTDYYWESVNIAGEFDGKVKFTREQYSANDPAGVAWREKRREDRLRKFVATVVRVGTADIERPAVLKRLLLDAGVPMRRGG